MIKNFQKGLCYFLLEYCDDELRIPSIETYIFVGKNIIGDPHREPANDRWYFQNPDTVLKYGYFVDIKEKGDFGVLSANLDTLESIFGLGSLCLELQQIHQRE